MGANGLPQADPRCSLTDIDWPLSVKGPLENHLLCGLHGQSSRRYIRSDNSGEGLETLRQTARRIQFFLSRFGRNPRGGFEIDVGALFMLACPFGPLAGRSSSAGKPACVPSRPLPWQAESCYTRHNDTSGRKAEQWAN